MASVPETMTRLLADRDTGVLNTLCRKVDVDLLVLFGSARTDPEHAHDIDVAYSFHHGTGGDDLTVVNALGERYGDLLDIMPLDRAGPVAAYAALGPGEVLVQTTPEKFALRQMAAFRDFVDTQRFRDMELELMRQ